MTVRHVWWTERGIAIGERQDIVYRDMAGQTTDATGEAGAQSDVLWQRSWACGPVLLFRYSALTFNAHRIHYDRRYATEIEGYPDLVVHAPLQATALMMLASEARGSAPLGFAFRGVHPLFASGPFTVKGNREGNGLRLWACDQTGRTTMKARPHGESGPRWPQTECEPRRSPISNDGCASYSLFTTADRIRGLRPWY